MTGGRLVLPVPDLRGPGFRLRAWHPDDDASLVRAWHDDAIVAGSSPPSDRNEAAARRWIEGCDERRRAGVAFDLVIAGLDDGGAPDAPDGRGEVLGELGLSRMDAARGAAVMGWWLHEAARGRGLAAAAVGVFADWLLGPAGLRAVLAEIAPVNRPSVRVAERAGFAPLDGGEPSWWVRLAAT